MERRCRRGRQGQCERGLRRRGIAAVGPLDKAVRNGRRGEEDEAAEDNGTAATDVTTRPANMAKPPPVTAMVATPTAIEPVATSASHWLAATRALSAGLVIEASAFTGCHDMRTIDRTGLFA